MAVLVGIYLVQCVSIEVELDGETTWMGAWTVSRSPSGNRHDWEPLAEAVTSQYFANAEDSCRAGEAEATALARQLQGDDCLEPMSWCEEASPQVDYEISPGRLRHTSQAGPMRRLKAASARSFHLH